MARGHCEWSHSERGRTPSKAPDPKGWEEAGPEKNVSLGCLLSPHTVKGHQLSLLLLPALLVSAPNMIFWDEGAGALI